MQEIPFGVREGFGVYLDGVNLPDEVYRDCDSNFVVSELDRLLSGHGSVESHWQGPTETALLCVWRFSRTDEAISGRLSLHHTLCAVVHA